LKVKLSLIVILVLLFGFIWYNSDTAEIDIEQPLKRCAPISYKLRESATMKAYRYFDLETSLK
jgi:hypothetical protein